MADWIPCDKELPDDCETVILFLPSHDDPVQVGFHGDDGWMDYNGRAFNAGLVTHWQPLPEPPKP
jgi:hypothetical protein